MKHALLTKTGHYSSSKSQKDDNNAKAANKQKKTRKCRCIYTYPTCIHASCRGGVLEGSLASAGSMSTSVTQVALSASVFGNVYTPTD